MAIHKLTPIIILAILLTSTQAFISRHCDPESVFEAKFSKQLLKKPIKKFLKEFQFFEINPSVKSRVFRVPWTDDDGEDTWAIIEKVIVESKDQERELTTKISDLISFRQSLGLSQMIACLEMTSQRKRLDKFRKENAGCVYEATEIYILYEDSNHSFSDEKTNQKIQDNFSQLQAIERLKVYWQLAQGLKLLHEKSYVLGHITASTVLTYEKNPKIAKFSETYKISKNEVKISDKLNMYVPFEAIRRGSITPAFDIYSFGVLVVVMEYSEAQARGSAEQLLEFGLEFYWQYVNNRVKKLLTLKEQYGPISSEDKGDNFIKLISECINEDSSRRPTASELVDRLEWVIKDFEARLAGKRNPARKSKVKALLFRKNNLNENQQVEFQPQSKLPIKNQGSNFVTYQPKSKIRMTHIWTVLGMLLVGFMLVAPVVLFGLRNISM